jgi:hypothetical protein
MTSFNVTSFKILRSFQLSKSRIPCSRLDGLVKLPDALLCREDSDSLACIRLHDRATPFGRSSVFEKNLESFTDTDWEDSLQPSGRGLNKETREACYGRRLHSSPSGRFMPPSRRRLEKSKSDSIQVF